MIEFIKNLLSIFGKDEKPAKLTISQTGIDLIKHFEGLRLEAYRDPTNVITIGYGHTKTAQMGQVITEKGAESLLRKDIAVHSEPIERLVKVQLTQGEYDALCSFIFNLGEPAFKSSTLLRKLNSGDKVGAAKEFDKWVYAGGKVLPGLKRRRAAERTLFETGQWKQ